MSRQELTRRLSAILSADVKGFSRLMSRNDVAAVATINHHRALIARKVESHQGRVVDLAGDGLLAEFGSALAAVQCGLAMQERLRASNRRLSQEERMCFRLGIDLGDVLHQGSRVYGQAVNIAARLQALAPPGGVFISGAVYDQVRSRLSVDIAFQGEKSLKNLPHPVRVYGLTPEGGDCNQECGERGGWTAIGQVLKKAAGAAMRIPEALLTAAPAFYQMAWLIFYPFTMNNVGPAAFHVKDHRLLRNNSMCC